MSQFEKLEGIPELGVVAEQTEGEPARDERPGLPQASRDVLGVGAVIPLLSPDGRQQQVPVPVPAQHPHPTPPQGPSAPWETVRKRQDKSISHFRDKAKIDASAFGSKRNGFIL